MSLSIFINRAVWINTMYTDIRYTELFHIKEPVVSTKLAHLHHGHKSLTGTFMNVMLVCLQKCSD